LKLPGHILCLGLACHAGAALAEVTQVTIASRVPVAAGQVFGSSGAYERLTGSIEFALDPAEPHNRAIVDLDRAAKQADGKVHFSADLYVLQPVQPALGNGTLLVEIANRGNKGLLAKFNRATASADPVTAADLGDGLLMREGYTLVWVGWQFDVAAPGVRVEAPAVDVAGRANLSFVPNEAQNEFTLNYLPAYAPVTAADPAATLTVRDRFWQQAVALPRSAWRLGAPAPNGRPRVILDSGFEPGRIYEIEYAARGDRVSGVGMAAIRDATAAFRARRDLPVHGERAYVFGSSQSGRFLRTYLHDGFNVDEHGRRVFDLVWAHIAGAGYGSFNERFAKPGFSSFPVTRPPYTDAGLLSRYTREQRPRIIYTNTPVEYWGQGRAAALTHTSLDGKSDLTLPDDVRSYLLAGAQHAEAPLPPPTGLGQAPGNPTPQVNVMRALLHAADRWVVANEPPPPSRVPRLRDATLTTLGALRFPLLPGTGNPRTIEGPPASLPFLVPQTDADGNELAGIRVPEQQLPLATTTGWNFRAPRVGNPGTTVALLGGYFPLARTRAEREANHDPRLSIAERYVDRADYLQRIRTAATALVAQRLYLAGDVDEAVERAARHWDWATGTTR
jgi:Alpha/beta hydrolase domain